MDSQHWTPLTYCVDIKTMRHFQNILFCVQLKKNTYRLWHEGNCHSVVMDRTSVILISKHPFKILCTVTKTMIHFQNIIFCIEDMHTGLE